MMVTGVGSYTEHVQGYQDNWMEEEALLLASGTSLEVGPEEGRHMHNRGQNGGRGGAGPKRTDSLAWGKSLAGLTKNTWKFGYLISHSKKPPRLPHSQNKYSLRGAKKLYLA